MTTPLQGDIWWAETEGKRRPVLVVTRDEAIPVLRWVTVAPVTRTVRDIPTEVPLGPDEGLPDHCAAAFDNVQPIRRALLTEHVGALGPQRRDEICRALRALSDC
ncbi:type II toxin-antitoxin system PemK/MazF family toxin [Iamia sp. SCSIO 61187]|uniref:type II toxin-antitoxin system PemK/MazF family toxin n=1 Tax=Iamia sp. SCSIO 61187 TaxID=2722752 RepID=UPI001C632918|nr:type II toxin-antitoxin system PemK/MazF family toxin [Iamia sp. SCSIO 61187]QYG93622.1 type II toxin-antitoxin system PemK/MazF family toxin [Iamia sp. SCSIO 61187]